MTDAPQPVTTPLEPLDIETVMEWVDWLDDNEARASTSSVSRKHMRDRIEAALAPVFARAKQAEDLALLALRFVDYETMETADYLSKYGLDGRSPVPPQRKVIVDLIRAALEEGAKHE